MKGTKRSTSVDWSTIFNEWSNGTGPEKSFFEGTHPSNSAIQNSGLSNQGVAVDMISIIDNFLVGTNIQVQMMGSYNASFYKLGDKTLSLIQDSKSKTSFYYHLPVNNYERGSRTQNWKGVWYSPKKQTNTYQSYLFWGK